MDKKKDAKKLRAVKKVKLVVLGSGGVGRDAAAIKYVSNQFKRGYDPVIEATYTKLVDLDQSTCLLNIVVTAGIEQCGL